MRIIVIGAGVMGASVAYRAAQAGAIGDRAGSGPHRRRHLRLSFAWTNSNEKTPRAYHDLNVAGMKAHAALAEEFGATPWWHGGGNVEWTRRRIARRSRRRSSACSRGAMRPNGSRRSSCWNLSPTSIPR